MDLKLHFQLKTLNLSFKAIKGNAQLRKDCFVKLQNSYCYAHTKKPYNYFTSLIVINTNITTT